MQNELKPCDFKKFNGKKIEEVANHREDISWYNNNYYEDDEGNIIHAWSDDDNYTEYTRVTITNGKREYFETFAESYTSENDIMIVYDEFMKDGVDNAE